MNKIFIEVNDEHDMINIQKIVAINIDNLPGPIKDNYVVMFHMTNGMTFESELFATFDEALEFINKLFKKEK